MRDWLHYNSKNHVIPVEIQQIMLIIFLNTFKIMFINFSFIRLKKTEKNKVWNISLAFLKINIQYPTSYQIYNKTLLTTN